MTESLDVAVDTIKLDCNFEKSVTYHFELKKTSFRSSRASRKYLICHTIFMRPSDRLSDKGLSTDVICLDLLNVFDSVPHERLLTKIHANVSKVHSCLGLEAFLLIDTRPSSCGEHHSSWTSVLSGLPQGALLRPISFLIYINDISRNIMSDTKLFANDMKVYRVSGLLRKTWKSYRKIFLT